MTVVDEGALAQLLRTRMCSLRRIPILSPVSCNRIPGQLSLLTLGTSKRSAHRCCSHRSHVAHRNHWRATQRSPTACTLLGPPSTLFHHAHPARLLRLRPRKHEPRRQNESCLESMVGATLNRTVDGAEWGMPQLLQRLDVCKPTDCVAATMLRVFHATM